MDKKRVVWADQVKSLDVKVRHVIVVDSIDSNVLNEVLIIIEKIFF